MAGRAEREYLVIAKISAQKQHHLLTRLTQIKVVHTRHDAPAHYIDDIFDWGYSLPNS
jgi:hypothetical protein